MKFIRTMTFQTFLFIGTFSFLRMHRSILPRITVDLWVTPNLFKLFLLENMRLSSKVLKTMSVWASIFFMLYQHEWTLDCLIMKNIEIFILLKMMNNLTHNFYFTMSIGAKWSVFTVLDVIWEILTESSFIFWLMIKNFKLAMSSLTKVCKWTKLLFLSVLTHLCSVILISSSSILYK